MKERINIPAGHKAILSRYSDNSGFLVLVLAVGNQPRNRFGVVASYVFNRHRIFRI
jgi:hypothetical protein